MTGEFDLADVGRHSSSDAEEDIRLLGRGIGTAFCGDACAVISVLLHELPDVLQGAVEFIGSIEFAELQLGGIENLVRVGVTGSAFRVDGADKEIE